MTQHSASSQISHFSRLGIAVISLALIGTAFAGCGVATAKDGQPSSAATTGAPMMSAQAPTSHVTLTIVAQKPGSAVDGPAYTPSTSLTLPANSLVTVTITNDDAGDTALPANSPFAKVTGVQGGQALVDGAAYSSLSPDKVAHTFTIPGLGVSVPVPGDAPAGHKDITVTFSFKTAAAGHYMWQCMDPCGANPNGWGGPMATQGYMMGMVTVA